MLIEDAARKVLVHVAGCPSVLATEAMRSAAIEFLKETRLLHTGMRLTFGGQAGGSCTVDMATELVDVLDAKVDGEQIRVCALNDTDGDDAVERGELVLTMLDAGTLVLRPAPTALAPVAVDLLVVIAPGPSATEIPDTIWRSHHEALVHGTLERLMVLPQKAWTSAELGGYHAGKFRDAIAKATAHTHRNVLTPARRLRVRPA